MPAQGELPGGVFLDFQQVFQLVLSCSVISSTINPAHPPSPQSLIMTLPFVSLLFGKSGPYKMEEEKNTKGCSPPKEGEAARTGPFWEPSNTLPQNHLLLEQGNYHQPQAVIDDYYQYYHTNGKTRVLLQGPAHVAEHRATSLSHTPS